MNFLSIVHVLAVHIELESPTLDFDITLFLQVGLFVIVMLFLNRFVLEPYLAAKDRRTAMTEGALEEAQSLKAKAEEAKKRYISKRQAAFAEIEADRKRSMQQALQEQSKRLEAKRAEVQQAMTEKQADFQRSLEEARAQSEVSAGVLAAEIAGKLLA